MEIAAASIAFGGAAVASTKFFWELNHAINEVKGFDREIRDISLRFKVFADAVEMTTANLEATCAEFPTLRVVEWLTKRGFFTRMATWSRSIKRQIRQMKSRFLRVACKSGFIAALGRLMWTMVDRPRIEQLFSAMESLKTHLFMTMIHVQLGIEKVPGVGLNVQKRIEKLEQIIQSHEVTINAFREQSLEYESSPDGPAKAGHWVSSEANDAGKMLLELGESLREKGVVPEILSLSGRRKRGRGRSRPSGREARPEPTILVAEPSSQLRRARTSSTHRHTKVQVRSEPRVVNKPEDALQSCEEDEHQISAGPRSPPATGRREVSMGSEGTKLTRRVSNLPTKGTAEFRATTPAPGQAIDHDHGSIEEKTNQPSIVDLEGIAKSGYISSTGKGPQADRRFVTAMLFPTLRENYICIRKAAELGLKATPVDLNQDGRSIAYAKSGGTPTVAHVVGTVTVNWWASAQAYNPKMMEVCLWVAEGLPSNMAILLGQSFFFKAKGAASSK